MLDLEAWFLHLQGLDGNIANTGAEMQLKQ